MFQFRLAENELEDAIDAVVTLRHTIAHKVFFKANVFRCARELDQIHKLIWALGLDSHCAKLLQFCDLHLNSSIDDARQLWADLERLSAMNGSIDWEKVNQKFDLPVSVRFVKVDWMSMLSDIAYHRIPGFSAILLHNNALEKHNTLGIQNSIAPKKKNCDVTFAKAVGLTLISRGNTQEEEYMRCVKDFKWIRNNMGHKNFPHQRYGPGNAVDDICVVRNMMEMSHLDRESRRLVQLLDLHIQPSYSPIRRNIG